MKYINTDRLIAEIERRKKERREFVQKRGLSSLGNAAQIRANEDEEILSLIVSLQKEQPEVEAHETSLKNAYNFVRVTDKQEHAKAAAEQAEKSKRRR